jgi:hypothetical protein
MNPIVVAAAVRQQSLRGSLSCGRLAPNMIVGDGATDFAFQAKIPIFDFDASASPAAVQRWKSWSRDNHLWELRHGRHHVIQTSKDRLAAVSHINKLRVEHVTTLLKDIVPWADPNPVESLYEEFQSFSSSPNAGVKSPSSPTSPTMEVATPTRGTSPEIPQMVDGPEDNKRIFKESFANNTDLARGPPELRSSPILTATLVQALASRNRAMGITLAPTEHITVPEPPFRARDDGEDALRELLRWGNGGILPVATRTQRAYVAQQINSVRNMHDPDIVSAMNFLELTEGGIYGELHNSNRREYQRTTRSRRVPLSSSPESPVVPTFATEQTTQLLIDSFAGPTTSDTDSYDPYDYATTPTDAIAADYVDLLPLIAAIRGESNAGFSSPLPTDVPLATQDNQTYNEESGKADDEHDETAEANDADEINDTVGVIVIDRAGNLACGSSSGGLGMKMRGRAGPAGIPNAGTAVVHADKDDPEETMVSVVASGTGEYITSTCAAKMAAERLYHGQKKVTGGRLVDCDDSDVLASFIQKEFLGKLLHHLSSP